MSDQTPTAPPAEKRHRFTLPSAYTILFALIVADGDRDLDHPGRRVQARQGRAPRSRAPTTRSTATRSGS